MNVTPLPPPSPLLLGEGPGVRSGASATDPTRPSATLPYQGRAKLAVVTNGHPVVPPYIYERGYNRGGELGVADRIPTGASGTATP